MEVLSNEKFKANRIFLAIFLFSIFSGAIRKWVFTDKGIGNVIFFIQLITPFFFFIFSKTKRYSPFTSGLFLTYFFVLIGLAFNPLNKTVFHGLTGILIHFGMWYALFYYFTNRPSFKLDKLFNIIIGICVFEVVLGFVQYGLPGEHFLNKYADEAKVGGSIATVANNAVRICGTFSYISGYTSFLLFYPFLMWVLIKKNFRPYITISLMFFGLIAAFMSGSRSATFIYVLFMGYLFLFELKKENVRGMLGGIIPPIVVLLLVFLAKGKIGFEDKIVSAFDNFNERRTTLQESGEEKKRVFWEYEQLINFEGNYPLFGIGLGSTYQGAIAIWGPSDLLREHGYLETELTRTVVEGGFVLLIFRFILIIYVVSHLYIPQKSKIFLGLFVLVFGGFVFNVYNAVFLLLGIMLVDNYYYQELVETEKKIESEKKEAQLAVNGIA